MEKKSFLQALATHLQKNDVTLGDCFRALRERKGLSSRALAAKCNLSSSYVSKVEHNTTSPSAVAFSKLVAELDCSSVEILFLLNLLRSDES